MNTLFSGIIWGVGIWIGYNLAEKCLPALCDEFKKGWEKAQE